MTTMRNRVFYEWCFEEVDDYGDIVDNDFRPALEEFEAIDVTHQLVLVRDTWNEVEGIIDRQWAYVENDELPEFFKDAHQTPKNRVPNRFQKEFTEFILSYVGGVYSRTAKAVKTLKADQAGELHEPDNINLKGGNVKPPKEESGRKPDLSSL